MELQYLLFDRTDEAWGAGSFDAMASVVPARVAALLDEVGRVLHWAHAAFGVPAAGDQGVWDFALHASAADEVALQVEVDASGGVSIAGLPEGGDRVTLTLTLSGSQAFCDAFAEAFTESG